MTSPDHAEYDPFNAARPAPGQGAPGFGGGPGYQGYYADPARNAPGMPGGQPAVSTGKGLAIAALILGLLAIPSAFVLFGGLLAVVSIILAIVALRAGSKARKLGSTQTGGTTAMSVIGILSSVLALVIFGFVLWGVAIGAGAAAECQHLINDQAAFDACIQDSVMGRLGIN